MSKVKIFGDIGINHNNDMGIIKTLIKHAKKYGFESVKFQKRDINSCYDEDTLNTPRVSPWGSTTREQKEGLELSEDQYKEIEKMCKEEDLGFFASCWDTKSQEFMRKFDTRYNKVASPLLTHLELLEMIAEEGKLTYISTGMSKMEEIFTAVEIFRKKNNPFSILHCVSSYPTAASEANLKMIPAFKTIFPDAVEVGISSHEKGLQASLAAIVMGASVVERHITINNKPQSEGGIYGSDHTSSLSLDGMRRLNRDIRDIEQMFGDGIKRVYDSELSALKKLRRY